MVAMVKHLYCYYGNHANVYKFVQSDAHLHYHCQQTPYKYYLCLIVVAMATLVVDYTRVQGSMVIGITAIS